MADKTDEGTKDDVQKETPESVSWQQYVATKEAIGKKLEKAQEEIKSLEEKLATAPKDDEYKEVKTKLDEITAKYNTASEELNKIKEQSLTQKKNTLKERGVAEEKLADMTEKELDAALMVLGTVKTAPKLDLGTGSSGGESLKGINPMELARRAYKN